MFLYLVAYLLFFTNTKIYPSSTTAKHPKGTVHFNDLKNLNMAVKKNVAQKNSIDQATEPTTTTSTIIKLPSNINSKVVENSLDLSRMILLNKNKLVSPDKGSSSTSLKTQPTQINEFKEALNIYHKLKNNHVEFINTINKELNKNYTFNTSAENILADFIGEILKEIVQTKLSSSWFSKKLEFFLLNNLEKEVITNYKLAESIQAALVKVINHLEEIKSTILNNENKDLQINYFNKTLPVDTWIELTKNLSENIESLIPQTKEEKDEKDIQSLEPLAQEFKEHQKIKSDWNKGLEDLFEKAEQEQKEILDRQKNLDLEKAERAALEKYMEFEAENFKALEEQRKQKEAIFNKSKEKVEAHTLQILKTKVNENFETLKQREQEIQLPAELIKINILLNTIKILLIDKKDSQKLKETFTVLLSAVYQELISPSIMTHPPFLLTGNNGKEEKEEGNPDSYILKDELDKEVLYKPLYNIIIYKLNNLLLLYATVIGDIKLEQPIEVTLRFIESNEIKKYSFSTSIFNLIALNEKAEFYNGSLLKSKAHPLEFRKALSIGAKYLGKKASNTLDIFGEAGEELGKAGEELVKIFATPIRWVNSFFEESQKAKEEARKKKEEEQQKLKDEFDAHNKLLQSLIESLNPKEISKASTELSTKNISALKETAEGKNPTLKKNGSEFAKALELMNSSQVKKETPKVKSVSSNAIEKNQAFNWKRALLGDTTENE